MCLGNYNMVMLDNAFLCHSVIDELFNTNKLTSSVIARRNCIEFDCEVHNIIYSIRQIFPHAELMKADNLVKDGCRLFNSFREIFKRRVFLRSLFNSSN